jgi:hypothetical protein
VVSQVWFGECGLAGLASVGWLAWQVWFGNCGLASVVWQVWVSKCGLASVVGKCGLASVVWQDKWDLSDGRSIDSAFLFLVAPSKFKGGQRRISHNDKFPG